MDKLVLVGVLVALILLGSIGWMLRPAKKRRREQLNHLNLSVAAKLGIPVRIRILAVRHTADIGLFRYKPIHRIRQINGCWVAPSWVSYNEDDVYAVDLSNQPSTKWSPETPMLVMFNPIGDEAGEWLVAAFGSVEPGFISGDIDAYKAPCRYLGNFPCDPLSR